MHAHVCVCCVHVCACACVTQNNNTWYTSFALKVSAKHGDGVEELLPTVVGGISRCGVCSDANAVVRFLSFSSPLGSKNDPLRLLLIDCWYELHRGVVCLMVVIDGTITRGMIPVVT